MNIIVILFKKLKTISATYILLFEIDPKRIIQYLSWYVWHVCPIYGGINCLPPALWWYVLKVRINHVKPGQVQMDPKPKLVRWSQWSCFDGWVWPVMRPSSFWSLVRFRPKKKNRKTHDSIGVNFMHVWRYKLPPPRRNKKVSLYRIKLCERST